MEDQKTNDTVIQVVDQKSPMLDNYPKKQPKQPVQNIRRFEIQVFNEDYNENTGKPEYTLVSFGQPMYIDAVSQEDFKSKINLYEKCGQKVKILREIPMQQNAVNDNATKQEIQAVPQTHYVEHNSIEHTKKEDENKVINTFSNVPQVQLTVKQPIKYYKIGDIDIKNDNGRIFQKQWMKLTDLEASNFRILNDKNNSIVNMTGKHLEMKKWIEIVTTTDDQLQSLEENL